MMGSIIILVLCVIFWKNHLFAVICYGLVLYLMTQSMTVMIVPEVATPLVLSMGLFLILFYLEIRGIVPKNIIGKNQLLIALSVIRFPVNWNYLSDFIFRLHHWGPIVYDGAQPSLGAAVGFILLGPVYVVLFMSIMLVALYFVPKLFQRKL